MPTTIPPGKQLQDLVQSHPQRVAKGCDNDCFTFECNHPSCHEGSSQIIDMRLCEECEQIFCDAHLVPIGPKEQPEYHLCAPCLVKMQRTTSTVQVNCQDCGKHVGTQHLSQLQPEPKPMVCNACTWERRFKAAKEDK